MGESERDKGAGANIIGVFLAAAQANPDCVALMQDGEAITYGALYGQVLAEAHYLSGRGIGPGDRVLVFVPMSIRLYRTVLALFYLGAVPVFLDAWVSLARLHACLAVVPCRAVIAGRLHLWLGTVLGAYEGIGMRIPADQSRPAAASPMPPPASRSQRDTALVTFTTGSTGVPKAADRTHGFLAAQLSALRPLLAGVGSPCAVTLPVIVLLMLAEGKAVILPPKRFKASRLRSARHLAAAISGGQARAIVSSPALLELLARDYPGALQTVKRALTGGGPVTPSMASTMLAAMPGAHITAVYGSTEAEPISHLDAAELATTSAEVLCMMGLPVGYPDAAAQVAILRLDASWEELSKEDAFAAALALPGIAGEVLVAGDHVLRGYIGNPAAERATKLQVGGRLWHRTGDCGLTGPDGRLYLRGRCDELFAWQGHTVYPALIAAELAARCGLTAAAVLLQAGQPVLVIERGEWHMLPAHGPGRQTLLASLGLAGATVVALSHLPRDPRHRTKINYPTLREAIG